MLSGDTPAAAAAMASAVGIPLEQVFAGVKPAGKAEVVRQLQVRRGWHAWVGVAPLGGWVCVAALWVGRWVDHACVGEWVGVALGAGGAPLHPWKAPSASRLLCCIALGWWWQGGMFWTITLDQAGSLVPAGPCRQI